MLPRIFDLFTQVKGSMSRYEKGLGLGYLGAQHDRVARRMCASRECRRLGHGTEFVVRLPLLMKMPAECPVAQGKPIVSPACTDATNPDRR